MNQLLRSRLKVAASAFASNAVNGNLRRAQLSYFAAWTAEWAFTVALGIVAYRDGGATAVGLVGLLRMVPSAVFAPLAAPLADRGRRERVLVLVSTIRGVATGAAGIVVALDGSVLIIYVLAALSTVAGTLYLPAHSALLPSLCRTGQELTSANAVRGMLDSVATLAGPLLAAVLVEFTDVAVVFAFVSGASLAAGALVLRLRYDAPPRPAAPRGVHLMAEVAEGIRTIVRNRDLALLNGLAIAQTFTRGALTVFIVVVALDLLRIGEPGVGTLTAAVGAGAVIGSLAASLLVGSRRLARWFGIGIALWGLPIALIPLFPQEASALILLACVGFANALVDIGLYTLMARLAPDAVLARLFGLQESLVSLTVGLGAVCCLPLDRSDKRVRGNGRRRCALSDPGGWRHGVAWGDLTAISENSTKRSGCSTACPCFSRCRCLPSNSSRAAWNLSTCLPARRYFTRVIRPTAST